MGYLFRTRNIYLEYSLEIEVHMQSFSVRSITVTKVKFLGHRPIG